MRDWNLGPGDPLALTLAADYRFCPQDYINDHIWELELGGGDPPALSLYTTYGLRARRMRIFPRFTLGNQSVSDPAVFSTRPHIRRFFPNYLALDFSPFPNIEVRAEYWIPESHAAAGRLSITNRSEETKNLVLELCGQLTPLEGQNLASISLNSVNILAGKCADLAPVIFLTGGPDPGPGPYPSLALILALSGGGSCTLTWSEAALGTPNESFDRARNIAARPWEAECAKIELVNASMTVDVRTGEADWDAAFAMGQKTAFGLVFEASKHLPHPTFMLTRNPDQGYSPRGDGSDYGPWWSGQSIQDATFLASQLPGSPELAAGLVRNFLSVQDEFGVIDGIPGLAGQRGNWLAGPLIASLAWKTFEFTRDSGFLREILPGLEAFICCWFDKSHDRDEDGFPEWDQPLQSGFEDDPSFSIWQADSQGANISTSESPALAALLCREFNALALIANALNQPDKCDKWKKEADRLSNLTLECWDAQAGHYQIRDRDTHLSPKGRSISTRRGPGTLSADRKFAQPVRLLIRLQLVGEATRRPEVKIKGQENQTERSEEMEREDFQWGAGLAVATTRFVYTSVSEITINGLEKRDRVSVLVMDFTREDASLFLPIWTGIPDSNRAAELVEGHILKADQFGGNYGIPDCKSSSVPARDDGNTISERTTTADPQQPGDGGTVRIACNELLGEGMLKCGLRQEAADLVTRLMTAVIKNLKREHAFAHAYNSASGAPIGERNSLVGLPPLGLFLETLGVRIEKTPGGSDSKLQVVLSGKNPFPWPVTVKYRGLTITRHSDETLINWPDGQTVKLNDPTEAVVSVNAINARDTR